MIFLESFTEELEKLCVAGRIEKVPMREMSSGIKRQMFSSYDPVKTLSYDLMFKQGKLPYKKTVFTRLGLKQPKSTDFVASTSIMHATEKLRDARDRAEMLQMKAVPAATKKYMKAKGKTAILKDFPILRRIATAKVLKRMK